MKTYKLNVLATALTKITHMMGTKGNESLINREGLLYNGKVIQVPFLSGNAIRHKMIREPGSMDLIKQCDLRGKLSIEQLNFMLNGGSLTDSSISTNIGKIYNMQKLLPLYRLLGGSLSNQVVSGSLNVSFGFMFCKENQERISKLLEDKSIVDDFKLRNFEHFIGNFQYTRSSSSNTKGAKSIIRNDETDTNLMIYNGQTLIPGTKFLIQFHLINCDDIELGALLNALQCYIDEGCNIGGMSRIGHGRIGLEFLDDEYDYQYLIDQYREYIQINSYAIENWFNETFPFVKKEPKVLKEKISKKKIDKIYEKENDIALSLFDQE